MDSSAQYHEAFRFLGRGGEWLQICRYRLRSDNLLTRRMSRCSDLPWALGGKLVESGGKMSRRSVQVNSTHVCGRVSALSMIGV